MILEREGIKADLGIEKGDETSATINEYIALRDWFDKRDHTIDVELNTTAYQVLNNAKDCIEAALNDYIISFKGFKEWVKGSKYGFEELKDSISDETDDKKIEIIYKKLKKGLGRNDTTLLECILKVIKGNTILHEKLSYKKADELITNIVQTWKVLLTFSSKDEIVKLIS